MKITYKNLLENIKDKPDIKNISDILFQLGHEHEIKKEIFDIEITPNRGDCLSLRGLLRELNLFYDVKINNNIYEKQIDKLKLNFTNNAQDFCPKISFLKVDIDHVPDIYSNQLESYFHDLDITKNNFFTDVSNYVSYETGQPTHCYKYSLFENEIIYQIYF